jgi:hypothetical protein
MQDFMAMLLIPTTGSYSHYIYSKILQMQDFVIGGGGGGQKKYFCFILQLLRLGSLLYTCFDTLKHK